jgi:hypothetical protein
MDKTRLWLISLRASLGIIGRVLAGLAFVNAARESYPSGVVEAIEEGETKRRIH